MFTFEETTNVRGQFAYKVKKERPTYLSYLIFLWWPVYLLGEFFLGVCFFMCAFANTEDGIGDYISRWNALDDWFFNRDRAT